VLGFLASLAASGFGGLPDSDGVSPALSATVAGPSRSPQRLGFSESRLGQRQIDVGELPLRLLHADEELVRERNRGE
jgi:hypothetical protein